MAQEGYEGFGVYTEDLHYTKESILSCADIAEFADEQYDDSEYPKKFKFRREDDFLESTLKKPLNIYGEAFGAYVGIGTSFPFDDPPEEWKKLDTKEKAAAYVGEALAPFFKENAEEIASKCEYYNIVREC